MGGDPGSKIGGLMTVTRIATPGRPIPVTVGTLESGAELGG